MEYKVLSNGVKMPALGYGAMLPNAITEQSVLDALETGYRLFDTSQGYFNEQEVGNALKKSGVTRQDLFVTTKMWVFPNPAYEQAKDAIDESLRKLQTDYLDLMLIHQPFGDYYGAYHAMEDAYKAGKIRAIGVSNFYPDRLADLCSFTEIPPMVNQVETHPFNQQQEARKIMDKYHVQIEAWSPFAEGKNDIFSNPVLLEIAEESGKTLGQVVLRFLNQSGVVVIPQSRKKERMAENFDIFDFELSEDQMLRIQALDMNKSSFFNHQDPATVGMMKGLLKNGANF